MYDHINATVYLIEDDAGGPHVHLGGDARRLAALGEALGGQVPVRACQ